MTFYSMIQANGVSFKHTKEDTRLPNPLKELNDLAERCLVQEFKSSVARNEEQRQFLLQVVVEHRKLFSAPTKAAAILRSKSDD